MGVIPAGAVLCTSEPVLHCATRWDRTLGHTVDAIVLAAVEHTNTVPVHRSTVVLKTVLDFYDYSITPVGFECRAGVLPVDQKTQLFETIRCHGAVRDLEVVDTLSAIRGSLIVEVGGYAITRLPASS
jgi:hypothetical protein